MATVNHLSLLLLLFTLTLSTHATLHLHTSDHHALLTTLQDLDVSPELRRRNNPCTAAGIYCERRISNNTLVLKVTGIVLKSQGLRGFLSPAIGNLPEIKELSFPNNHLAGQIPPQISGCRKLEIINLRNNTFSGEVSPELSSLLRLRILDLSSNRFSGELGFLKYFPNLEKLYLDNNKFAGKVPPAPENQKTNNKRLPKRYIFAGSSNSNNLTSPATSPAPANTPKHKHRKKLMGWIFGFFAGSLAGILSVIILTVLFVLISIMLKGGRNDAGPVIFTPSVQAEDLKAEDLAFLENDDEVAALQVIGRGGCGDVYKTEMPNGKFQTVAIKRIVQPPKDAEDVTVEDTKLLDKKMRQMQSEIQTVGQIRHRNLLPLLAHVPRRTCHYLVYEFMKNGSLQDLLEEVNAGTRELDWLARHRIAIGVVSGLEYLHIDHIPRIIHRDLKPANVLLDDNMEPRIADFGLAKLMAEADTHMTSSNIAWTPGYIAPEYHQTMKITDKCDIYSFGVLLGVLVIGKFPSDEFFQQTPENSLVKWMRQVMSSEDPTQAIDPNLLGNGYEKQMLCVLRIAYFCTLDNPKERPNSKKCRCMLNEIEY